MSDYYRFEGEYQEFLRQQKLLRGEDPDYSEEDQEMDHLLAQYKAKRPKGGKPNEVLLMFMDFYFGEEEEDSE